MSQLIDKESRLFLVEFGMPERSSGWITFGGSNCELFVIAKNYDQAARKAVEFKAAQEETVSVIDCDGSLKSPEDRLRIKSIKIISDTVVV